MKTQTFLRSIPGFAGLMVAGLTLIAVTTSRAGLQIPYNPDADTLHLWHLNDLNSSLTITDAVVTAGITLTNQVQTQVPGSTISLENAAFISQLGTSLHITATNNAAGNNYAFAVNREFLPDTTPFRNSASGAFTFEALVKLDGNPFTPANGNWEIICGDNSPGAGQTRGWQFRIQTPGVLNFNFITGGGGNFTPSLPSTGPDAAVAGQWYHVAVTYTGNAPTNSDTPGIFTFYWTLLDAGRTNATTLASFATAGTFTLGGTPVLGIGGSARNNNGVANGEGLKGFIDEVRISGICRQSNQMAFVSGGALSSPAFLQQPPTNTFLGYGQKLSLPALVTGSPAPSFQWQHASTNLPGQIDSTLVISNVTFADAGSYRLIASNSLNSVTSVVAQVTIGAAFSELFNTGVEPDGTLTGANINDSHYTLVQSGDFARLGPGTVVWDMGVYPIAANGGIYANIDGLSEWIGPQANSYASPIGQYVYRTRFLLDSVNLATARLQGIWWLDTQGVDILLNGQPTGNPSPNIAAANIPANFTITNGFVPGVNTLDFVTRRTAAANGSYQESAVRVELTGLGQALAPGLPSIIADPVSQTVRDAAVIPGSVAAFSVVALGRPPLSYQWVADNAPLLGATNRTLTFLSPATGSQGTNFKVIVSNDSGSVTSQVAVLTLVSTNQPPIAPGYNFTMYKNGTLDVDASFLFQNVSDPDGDTPLNISFDGISTNSGTITQVGVLAVYAPVPDYTGADQFNYYITDNVGGTTAGPINITVLPLPNPTVSSISLTGGNVVLSGTGGVAGGGYRVLFTTDLLTPLAQWTVGPSGVFDNAGNFNVTNAIAPGAPQTFYILTAP